MKKQEMVKNLAERLDLSQVKVNEVLKELEELIAEVIEKQDEVFLCGMKISTKEASPRKGMIENKLGKYEYDKPARIVPTVSFTKTVKNKLSKEI